MRTGGCFYFDLRWIAAAVMALAIFPVAPADGGHSDRGMETTEMIEVDLSERSELFHGIAGLVKTPNGVKPQRMTVALARLYGRQEYEDIRANCGAGVRMVFHTAAERLVLALKYGRTAREIFTSAVKVDDGEASVLTPDSAAGGVFELCSPGPGEHRYEIFLPNMCEVEITRLAVPKNARLRPAEYRNGKMIFIGDSITQGMTSSSPEKCYAAQLAGRLGADWVNLSIGGAEMQSELGKLAQAYAWDTAVVAYGVNDWSHSRSLDEFAEAVRGMLRHLSARPGVRIYIVAPIPCLLKAEPDNPRSLDEYRRIIFEIAADFPQVRAVDGSKLLPAEAEYFVDGCHPNDRGMTALAGSLAAVFK